MSISLLRTAVLAADDSAHAILHALKEPWKGALNRAPYTEVLVFCAGKKPRRKVEQMKMLGLLGADMSAVRSWRERHSPEVPDDALQQLVARRKAAEAPALRAQSSIKGLIEPLDIYEAVLTKFTGQLRNDGMVDGAIGRERIAMKGTLIASLENQGHCAQLLRSMKRSLIHDAGAALSGGYNPNSVLNAVNELISNDPTSFFWCSLTGTKCHAVDTVVRRTQQGFELTTCNRGEGACVEESGKAGALRSAYGSAEKLAGRLSTWTQTSSLESIARYNFEMHDVSATTKKEAKALDYRPQKLQKEGNCCTKSMFAALSFLMATDQDQLVRYKAFRRSLPVTLTNTLLKINGIKMAAE